MTPRPNEFDLIAEYFAPLAANALEPIASTAPDITWHIATLSKCAAPALRIAYIACYLQDRAMLRSMAWALGWVANLVLFFAGYR